MNKFIWVRKPTIINGLATTYVSKRGSDTLGNGTAQNPYASIAKATSVAVNGTNIMLDDGEWNEARILNGKVFSWWGNSNTKIKYESAQNATYSKESFFYLKLVNSMLTITSNGIMKGRYENCLLYGNITQYVSFYAKNCIIINVSFSNYMDQLLNCVLIKCRNVIGYSGYSELDYTSAYMKNCLCYNCTFNNTASLKGNLNFNNYCNTDITSIEGDKTINDQTTGQTILNYFNYLTQSIIYNPLTAPMDDWLKCDFTAKEGSKNIGAGEKGSTIGLNQGFAARADGTANDVFSSANGATLRNVAFNSNLGGYVLQQKDRVCSGATANTITFDNDASIENDYYKGLFVGITGGVGETQIRYITSYNGATRTATVNTNWETIPDTESEYSISGKIDSVVKDFGKAIKVKRNFTFVDNMTALVNGQWEEFLTAVNSEDEMIPASCYSYEYSVDDVTWRSSTELVSATDGTNYVDEFTIGDASEQFNEEIAEFLVFRYIRFHIHIGFNIDVFTEK